MSRDYLLKRRKAHDKVLINFVYGTGILVEYGIFFIGAILFPQIVAPILGIHSILVIAIYFLIEKNKKARHFILYTLSALECMLKLALTIPLAFLMYGTSGVVQHCKRHLRAFIKMQRTRR